MLWCDRDRLDELIADLKATCINPDFDRVEKRTRGVAILANIPVVSKLLGLSVEGSVRVERTMDASKVSDTKRLGDTIKFLIDKNSLSPFIGEKLEWDALNQIAYEIFQPVSLESSQIGANGDELIRSEHPILLSLIAKHFRGVIEESKQKVCFFDKKWEVKENETEKVLACTTKLFSPLQLNGGNSTVDRLTLSVYVPREVELCDMSQSNEVSAWLLGKIHRVDFSKNGDRTLTLNFKPTALVKTDDSE